MTLTKHPLIENAYERLHVSKNESVYLIETLSELIRDTLAAGMI